MKRFSPGMLIALAGLAGVGGVAPQGANVPGVDALRTGSMLNIDTPTTSKVVTKRSQVKLRDLVFLRPHKQRRSFKGVSMSVAQGKRIAAKVRNRQRHKKQWKAHVR